MVRMRIAGQEERLPAQIRRGAPPPDAPISQNHGAQCTGGYEVMKWLG